MKNFKRNSVMVSLIAVFAFGLVGPIAALAVTTPSLGAAATFGVLGSTYTNSAATTINGDVGYTTGPGIAPTVTGTNYGSGAPYSTAGTDQGSALTVLNAEVCNYTYPSATDLSLLPQPLVPGVYCISGGASIGTGGVTLSGNGTYVFKINGALTTVVNSAVTLTGGASACNVFWAPTAATTLGANSTFIGTNIDDSGITVGSTVLWTGSALAFGGTITTNADTITVPTSCTAPVNPATLNIVKLVINSNGGTAVSSDFNVHVENAGVDVAGSPQLGTSTPGTAYTLSAGTYTVSEGANSSYTQSFQTVGIGGDCNASGSITLAAGDNKTCTIVNSDIPALVTPPAPVVSSGGGGGGGVIVPLIGITKVPTPLALATGSGSVTYNYTVWNVGGEQPLTGVTVKDDKCAPISYVSGDVNNNNQLDPHEIWKYACTMTLASTTTNTAIATGHTGSQTAVATAVATVVVTPTSTVPGLPNTGLVAPIINILKVPSRLTPFPYGGGSVTYTYTVTNPGVVPMNNVTVTDNKCAPVSYVSGDANVNGLLDPGETWTYTCTANISVSTTNIATAKGTANGFTAISYAFSTVLVAAPGLPNTGFPSEGMPWNIVILAGILVIASTSAVLVLKKRKI